MKIQLTQPQLAGDLVAALRAGGCDCRREDDGSILAFHRAATDATEARVELAFFLRAWECQYPGVAVRFVD